MFKKFLIKIIFISLIALALIWSLNLFYTYNTLEKNKVIRIDKQFYDKGREKEIIYFGDSYVMMGLDPWVINNSFSFASPGENYITSYYKLKYILDNNIVLPERIIIQIDPHSFTEAHLSRLKDEWYWKKYINYMELEEELGFSTVSKHLIYSYLPIISNGKDFLNYTFRKPKLSDIKNGHEYSDADYSLKKNKIEKAASRVRYRFGEENREVFSSALTDHFNKILSLASNSGIEVILVKFPLTKEYYRSLGLRIDNLESFYDKIHDLIDGKNMDSMVTILDYQDVFFDKPEYFSDSDHLNSTGASELSKLISENLISL